ncbi:glyoxylate/hydroxypyruvate reductase A [Roseibium aquae]|uniref:Glyoxylate/hydroxypyruvate reductase A n=1 Tax=Roseibium aquae TaxID=1323746 RepID=A0A916WV71_9HYPH|nr:glyoxylate/hydroxypyruvate reductase A [Roseibium aquae]GGB33303.1 glyoxylate/hydroxypyruvate reductase A [Roseibium aquae]
MKPVVPFVSSAGPAEQDVWLTELPKALRTIASVKHLEHLSPAEAAAAKVAIVANPDVRDLRRLPALEWVHSLWAGVERLTAELPEDGPKIVRMTDPQMAETMAEAVLAWTLYLHRDMPRYAQQQRVGLWLEHRLRLPHQRRVSVLGLGRLGTAAALRLMDNGFDVAGWSRTPRTLNGVHTAHGDTGLRSILERTDIAVVLVPLTAQTRELLNTDALKSLPKGASLINFARGPIIDTRSLLQELDRGHLDHAVLDVFDEEPLPASSPLWSHPKITVLPHISAPTIPETACRLLARNIRTYLETGAIPDHVDHSRGY